MSRFFAPSHHNKSSGGDKGKNETPNQDHYPTYVHDINSLTNVFYIIYDAFSVDYWLTTVIASSLFVFPCPNSPSAFPLSQRTPVFPFSPHANKMWDCRLLVRVKVFFGSQFLSRFIFFPDFAIAPFTLFVSALFTFIKRKHCFKYYINISLWKEERKHEQNNFMH